MSDDELDIISESFRTGSFLLSKNCIMHNKVICDSISYKDYDKVYYCDINTVDGNYLVARKGELFIIYSEFVDFDPNTGRTVLSFVDCYTDINEAYEHLPGKFKLVKNELICTENNGSSDA